MNEKRVAKPQNNNHIVYLMGQYFEWSQTEVIHDGLSP